MLQDTDALRWSSFFGLRGFLSSISTSESSRELILSSARSDDFFHPCRMLFLWSLHQWLWFVRSFHGYLFARPCGILYQWCQTFFSVSIKFAYWDPKFQMKYKYFCTENGFIVTWCKPRIKLCIQSSQNWTFKHSPLEFLRFRCLIVQWFIFIRMR